MVEKITRVKLQGLLPYLFTRAKLRLSTATVESRKQVYILNQAITLNLEDLEQKYLYADCVREPENLLIYRAIAETGLVDTFIDIGANCGHVALSVLPRYAQLLLFEPNPKLAEILKSIFRNNTKVIIKECAIVDEASVGSLTLSVPKDSSGLATLGVTELSKQHLDVDTFEVRASTLAVETSEISLDKAYIKIDVEGFEANIIDSAKDLINAQRPIVGFEALSKEAALNCADKFNDYTFYCARFDFLESGGALMNSYFGILKALITNAHIEIVRLDDLGVTSLENFSQIFSVPNEKCSNFENSINDYLSENPYLDLSSLTTWSKGI